MKMRKTRRTRSSRNSPNLFLKFVLGLIAVILAYIVFLLIQDFLRYHVEMFMEFSHMDILPGKLGYIVMAVLCLVVLYLLFKRSPLKVVMEKLG